jgi:hypothetical protein
VIAGKAGACTALLQQFVKSRAAAKMGIQPKRDQLRTRPGDLGSVTAEFSFLLATTRRMIKWHKERFGFTFGQTIDNFRKGKVARRTDTLYSNEATVQKDGKTKNMNYKRVEDVGNFIAQKISQLKKSGVFKVWDLGNTPHGAAIVSLVVCKNKNNKTQTRL